MPAKAKAEPWRPLAVTATGGRLWWRVSTRTRPGLCSSGWEGSSPAMTEGASELGYDGGAPKKIRPSLSHSFPPTLSFPCSLSSGQRRSARRGREETGKGSTVGPRAGPGPHRQAAGSRKPPERAEPLPRAGASVDGSRDGISRPGQPRIPQRPCPRGVVTTRTTCPCHRGRRPPDAPAAHPMSRSRATP